jgi:DNA-binding IclR family transcriptional regulator
MNAPDIPERVLHFIADKVDTVSELEALLLLWQDPDKRWDADEIAARVYVPRDTASLILRSLHKRQLLEQDSQSAMYSYSAEWDTTGTLMAEVAAVYRSHLVQVSTFIHSRASRSVRDFARAFDLKRER